MSINAISLLNSYSNLQFGELRNFQMGINSVQAASAANLGRLNELISAAGPGPATVRNIASAMVNNPALAASKESDDALDYLTALKSGSQQMQKALGNLMGTSGSASFMQQSVVSSDADKLRVDAGSVRGGQSVDTRVNIDQLASGQVNRGQAMTADERVSETGPQEFQIEIDGKTHNFSVNAESTDTNRSMQQKIADAVNKADIGVTASVSADATANTSALSFQSKETGDSDANRFTVQEGSGGFIGQSGVGTVTQQAQDAIYRVNDGPQQKSASNSVDLGNGIKATLLEASAETVNLSARRDGQQAMSAVRDFVNSYNDLIGAAKTADTTRSMSLNMQMARTVNTYSSSLNRIGIEMDASGRMSVNEDRLRASAANGELESFFNTGRNSNFGFANRMSDLARQVNTNPMRFTDLSTLGYNTFANNTYSSFTMSGQNTPYATGLFLNMFV